jgi:hypothetical protein
MNYTSRLDEPFSHDSTVRIRSKLIPAVEYTLHRVSFGRRLSMLRDLRELSGRAEFAAAGAAVGDRIEAAVLEKEIACYQLRWGVAEISGLLIDGAPATIESLVEGGPEALVHEVLRLIRAQLDLTEEERKN